MRLHYTFICVFFMLQDENSGLGADEKDWVGTEGGSVSVTCTFGFSGARRLFCREDCSPPTNVLIDTIGTSAKKGRYSLKYEKRSVIESDDMVVTITKLTKSDSGLYTCGLVRILSRDSYQKFRVLVREAPKTTPKPKWTFRPSTSSTSATTTTTQSLDSFTSTQTIKLPSTHSEWYVGLVLLVVIILFLVAVVYFCRKRSRKRNGFPEGPEQHDASPVYEEIRDEDRPESGFHAEDVSAVHLLVDDTKPNRDGTTDLYTLATASVSCTQDITEDDLTYSKVTFNNSVESWHNSAPADHTEVVYSVAQA